jgi:cytoskeletal protein CcmA (bactofilin family)
VARRDDAFGVTGADTIIGAGVIVQGNLASEGDMMVDGDVTGNIKAIGNLTIGVNAIIEGNIAGDNVTVLGALNGSINAESEAAIGETGKVLGDIRCGGLSVGSGAIFQGRVQMRSNQTLNLEGVESPEA